MQRIKSIAIQKAEKALKEGLQKAREYFNKQNKSQGKKGKNEKEEAPKKEPENKNGNGQLREEVEKKWTSEIEVEREKAANMEVGKSRGRAPGDLDKIENASTSGLGKEKEVQEINEERGIEKEKGAEKQEAEKTFQERIGEKKIDNILEEGKIEEEKSWAEKVRPDKASEFRNLDQETENTRAINLLKEDSSKFFMPENKNTPEMILDQNEKKEAVELMGEKKEELPQELLKDVEEPTSKNENKIDAYKATIKNHEEMEEIKEENFFEELQRDEMATENMEMDADMDMDAGGPDFD